MIFENNKRELQKSGDFKSQTFGIKNAGKIFKILVDGIYSDPYGSIVREYVSNAIDANIEAKTDKSVIVKWIDKNSITGSEDTLVIRDFGIGISQERMFDIFCNLGETTKDGSNDQIGGWGLGSKSAFKYTDSFSVKTIIDNIGYWYNLNLNAEGIAESNLIAEYGTEEENGTEVQIPIKYGDKYRFVEAIKNQLFYFPNIDYINLDIDKAIIEKEEENFIIATNCPNKSLNLKLGNVLYPINSSLLEIPYNLYNKNITLKFNIGEIFPIASREQIDYSEATKKKILEKLDLVRSEYTLNYLTEINNEKNLFKWFLLVCSFKSNSFLLKPDSYDFKFENKLEYNINLLKSYFHIEFITKVKGRKYNALPKINISTAEITDFKYPIYFKSNNYSSLKNNYLYDKLGNFLVIQPTSYIKYAVDNSIILGTTLLDESTYLKRQNWLLDNIKVNCDAVDYDTFELPKEEIEKIVKVKREKNPDRINYKSFYFDSDKYRLNGYCFSNDSDLLVDLNSKNIIYAFIDEKDDFIKFINLFTSKKDADSYNLKFIRIAESNEKLIKGIYYKRLFNQEMTTDELQEILTANYINNTLEYKYLEGLNYLEGINERVYKKYLKLKNYIQPHFNSYRYKDKEVLNATIDLAVKNNLLNNDILNLFNELVEYNKDIKLLSFLKTNEKDLIIDFLELKGKSPQQEKDLNQLKLELNIPENV